MIINASVINAGQPRLARKGCAEPHGKGAPMQWQVAVDNRGADDGGGPPKVH